MYNLFIDSNLVPDDVTQWTALPKVEWVFARKLSDVVELVTSKGVPQIVSFGQKLDSNLWGGLAAARYIYDWCLIRGVDPPSQYYIHAVNPTARDEIALYIKWVLQHKDKFADLIRSTSPPTDR